METTFFDFYMKNHIPNPGLRIQKKQKTDVPISKNFSDRENLIYHVRNFSNLKIVFLQIGSTISDFKTVT